MEKFKWSKGTRREDYPKVEPTVIKSNSVSVADGASGTVTMTTPQFQMFREFRLIRKHFVNRNYKRITPPMTKVRANRMKRKIATQMDTLLKYGGL